MSIYLIPVFVAGITCYYATKYLVTKRWYFFAIAIGGILILCSLFNLINEQAAHIGYYVSLFGMVIDFVVRFKEKYK